jgi:catechol 2,3-dioxygenase-like lactoylglutathione lyase family enzyme
VVDQRTALLQLRIAQRLQHVALGRERFLEIGHVTVHHRKQLGGTAAPSLALFEPVNPVLQGAKALADLVQFGHRHLQPPMGQGISIGAAYDSHRASGLAGTAFPEGHPSAGKRTGDRVHLGLVTIVVKEYDPAIEFFVGALGFELAEDSPATTNDGRPKRWVVVRPPGAATGLLLARADGAEQAAVVGRQAGGRVGFFLHVEDFDAACQRMSSAGVEFVRPPRLEPYGLVVVFTDIAGNKWDLIGPPD